MSHKLSLIWSFQVGKKLAIVEKLEKVLMVDGIFTFTPPKGKNSGVMLKLLNF
jgi:hypothetical protein